MTMLGYALLGLLARGAASGYDLTRQMQAPIGFFWRAQHSQIYPQLARLEAQGLVTHEVVKQQDVPDKKVYTITAEGIATLKQWVTETVDMPTVRDEILLKTFSMWLVDPGEVITLFRDQERRHAEQVRVYEALERELKHKDGVQCMDLDSPYFATYVTLQKGIGYERHYLHWCRWMVQVLDHAE